MVNLLSGKGNKIGAQHQVGKKKMFNKVEISKTRHLKLKSLKKTL